MVVGELRGKDLMIRNGSGRFMVAGKLTDEELK